ncbi:MAG: hypothetical protein IH956_00925 [Chloroflexi bacterium]|nr:hypothetical protein [Chloroflexota bacterium]
MSGASPFLMRRIALTRHPFVRLWRGGEVSLVGIMGWTTNRMLNVYRPYDVRRAKAEHQEQSIIKNL